MNAGDICTREVVIIRRKESVMDAARLMHDHHVGDLIVVEPKDGKNIPVGILTDRDIVLRGVLQHASLLNLEVGELMTMAPLDVPESEPLLDVIEHMRESGVRRLPVVSEAGTLVGIVTLDDVIDAMAHVLGRLARVVDMGRDREKKRSGW